MNDEKLIQVDDISELRKGAETAFIDLRSDSNLAYKPEFIVNSYQEGQKVLSVIERELSSCDSFAISVAFITRSGITPLLQILKELEQKGVNGRILTTDYLMFSEPEALKTLAGLTNVTLRMYQTDDNAGFHTKGYIFRKDGLYRILIGSSNMTQYALTVNQEWNTKIVSTESGEFADKVCSEFELLWNSQRSLDFDLFYDAYLTKYEIVKKQRQLVRREKMPSIEAYRLQPNSMQVGFISSLKKLYEQRENKGLLISATGTGKTYASAFAMREIGFKRVLFLVHRNQLARQTMQSYKRVFSNTVSMGVLSGREAIEDCRNKDYIFATVQTLSREENLKKFRPDDFTAIILDESHHSPANSYQRIMSYFKPQLWLGMTATPDKRDDHIEGRNVYELFNYNIVYEIRLQQAMEENLLCPFHYFGITDLSIIDDQENGQYDFSMLTSNERVKHIVEQATYYGYSGEKVKGLIFCRSIRESEVLSDRLNHTINPETGRYYRTIALNGSASEDQRQEAFERLAADENGALQPLDYILSVEILNEGIDIIEVNQVLMLRPTQSPIVFIQQLGRGLRKANGKEFVVILDFIGNYNNNFMIPIALSGDRTYNKDNIRRFVMEGCRILPGASTVHFDEISRKRFSRPSIMRISVISN